MQPLKFYNTYSRKTELFEPLKPPFVGFYLCGPTVYGNPHLGHVRGPVFFDVLHRYLKFIGYKVRFVRNITDVGHLVNDADEGEDKIGKLARLEQLEPMEVAQHYTNKYHEMLNVLNLIPASIEPRASGHIIEQIEMIETIIKNGYAYVSNGSVYFDVLKYSKGHDYGKLSGRILEDLIAGAGNEARELEGQDEKRNPNDFALWKNAGPEHIMQWSSPWGKGFPGWHIECSAMSRKYLGEIFDIHGGGMDLLFPHHESEIAQSTACSNHNPAKYWIHHNMVTLNGQKMAKSLGNGIGVSEFFSGDHPLLEQAYTPMTLKLFILMAHYRGTLDFSNNALQGAEKGLSRLLNAKETLEKLEVSEKSSFSAHIPSLINECYDALNEDLNTPILISKLFEMVTLINSIAAKIETISAEDLPLLKTAFNNFVFDILGLQYEKNDQNEKLDGVMKMLLEMRNQAKLNKNYALSDEIRNKLTALGFEIMDGKEGSSYAVS